MDISHIFFMVKIFWKIFGKGTNFC